MTTQSAKQFLDSYMSLNVTQPYFLGFFLIITFLKSFFTLKVTRMFGPFIKLITQSFISILLWTTGGYILMILMSNYLILILL